jgi:tetratricopeptide (TPR) repeat protein
MTMGDVPAPANGARRFAAFISYSHADAAIAAKLQSKLERYRLPKHVALARSSGEADLGSIFRDREDLAAAPSLSDAIRDAISRADALIVICSPDAKNSRWVGEEIALFRRLHPDRPVLAAVVRGGPADAFPAALTADGTEPLAADLRKEGDGEALGFLKIVAGVAGVPLDALVQRDAQRKLRRVTWITLGALAAMVVMAVMTTLALQARNEAARQRAEAEGLVEYMLTDLRDRLKGVGRLDVMDAVNDRAMDYYGGETIKGQMLKARILHAMGEDAQSRGRLAAAVSKFTEAELITAAAYSQNPKNPDVVIAHAQSYFWLGVIKEAQAQLPISLQHKIKYSMLVGEYVRLSGKNRKAMKELGWSHNTLGAAYLSQPDSAKEAEAHFRQYLRIFSSLVASDPEDKEARYSLMDANAWLADALVENGDIAGARKCREAQIKQIQVLIRTDPENKEWHLRRGIALRALARVVKRQGDLPLALATVDQALEQLNANIGFDPDNAEWRSQLIYAHLDRGFYGKAMERGDVVQSALGRANQLLDRENTFDTPIGNLSEMKKLKDRLTTD